MIYYIKMMERHYGRKLEICSKLVEVFYDLFTNTQKIYILGEIELYSSIKSASRLP